MRRISDEDKRRLRNLQNRLSRKRRKLNQLNVNYVLPSIGMDDLRKRSKKDFNNLVKFIESELKNEDYSIHKNKYGIEFTGRQKDILERQLKERNERMQQQWNFIKDLDVTAGGRQFTVQDIAENVRYGKYNRFNNRVKSIDDFQSLKEYNDYMDFLRKESNPNLLINEMKKYKKSLLKSINSAFGTEGTAAYNKLYDMSAEDLLKLYYTTDYLNPDFIYDPNVEEDRRLADINRVLGII